MGKYGKYGADISDVYIKVIERMEPDITAVDHAGAIASIAISLKRIADALEEANKIAEG